MICASQWKLEVLSMMAEQTATRYFRERYLESYAKLDLTPIMGKYKRLHNSIDVDNIFIATREQDHIICNLFEDMMDSIYREGILK